MIASLSRFLRVTTATAVLVVGSVVVPGLAAAATAPVNTVAPSISGTVATGQTLTAHPGTWTGDPTPTITYQWERCSDNPGVDWTLRTAGGDKQWYAITWGGPAGAEKYVATGIGGALMTSPDGATWTTVTTPDATNWISVVWGGPANDRKFVAVGDSLSRRVMTSPDGVTWTLQTAANTSANWYAVTWGGPTGQEQFVAVAGSGQVMTSPDGVTWTARTAAANSIWTSVIWAGPAGQEKFVAVGLPNNGSIPVMTSPDGITWTAQTPAANNNWITVTWGGPAGNQKFVAVATSGTGNRVMTSPDGVTWAAQASPADNNWNSVVWGGPAGLQQFVAVASSGTGNRVMTSPDGVTWTAHASPADNNWEDLVWGGPSGSEQFVAVATGGDANRVMTSGFGCVDIAGATATTHVLTTADVGKRIRVKVTGTNSAGTATAFSPAVGPSVQPPAGAPTLRVSASTPKTVRAGKRFTITVRVRNTTSPTLLATGTTAVKPKTCITLPRSLSVVKLGTGKLQGRRICWTRPHLAAGKSAAFRAILASSPTASGTVRIPVTATAKNDAAVAVSASTTGSIRLVEPQAVKPAPVTG